MVETKEKYKGNLSQIKREKLIASLETMKNAFVDNDEMLRTIGEIESELNSKKYGLVWEQHEERVDRMMKDNIPVFTEDHSKEVKTVSDNNYNFLLDGDNLHSLKLLEKTHKGQIDVIYIDPPYNTGKKDFVYNDRYVDGDDNFRHSKWLSFMYQRLKIARNLLKPEGVIFMSIDDNEEANLKLLCDEIFGEQNFDGLVMVENNPKGRKNSDFISVTSDYLLIYSRNKSLSHFQENIPKDVKDLTKDEYGNYVHNSGKRVLVGPNDSNDNVDDFNSDKHYSVYYRPSDKDFKIIKENNIETGNEKLINEGYDRYYSYNKSGFILNTYTAQKLYELFKNQALEFKNGKIYEKNFSTTIRIKSVISNRKYRAVINNKEENFEIDVKTTSAKNMLQKIFNSKNVKFDNPKNTGLIKLILTLFENKDLTILDFFAGSGTTGQAVLEQNKKDGGHRKFILCANDENDICEKITYQRIKTVITGLREDGSRYSEGLPANLKYYKTDFVSKQSDDVSDELMNHIAEMIQLEHGVSIDNKEYVMILSDDDADDLQQNWSEYKDLKGIYKVRGVMLTGEQEELFASVPQYDIPDYYFKFELKEVGEIW